MNVMQMTTQLSGITQSHLPFNQNGKMNDSISGLIKKYTMLLQITNIITCINLKKSNSGCN